MTGLELRSERLSNGASLLRAAAAPAAGVALGLWLRGGSASDPPALPGITHLIEHLMFCGAGTRTGESRLDTIVRLGGRINAGTAKECLSVQALVAPEHAAEALYLLGRMVFDQEYRRWDVLAEAARIGTESNSTDAGGDRDFDLAMRLAYPGHPLGNSISGDPEALASLKPELLRAWWREQLNAHNAALIVVGEADERLEGLCRELGERIPPGHLAAPPIVPLQPPLVRGVPAAGGADRWLIRGPALGEPGEIAFRLGQAWLSPVAEDLGWRSVQAHFRAGSLWLLRPPDAAAERAKGTLLMNQLFTDAARGPDARALQWVKERFIAQLTEEQADPVWTMTRLGEEWTVMGRARSAAELRQAAEGAKVAEVTRALLEAFGQAVAVHRPAEVAPGGARESR